jgi:hypothetical protein
MPELVFGHRSIGSTVEEVLTFTSLTGQPFEVLSVKAKDADVRVIPKDGLVPKMQAYSVCLRVSREGESRTVLHCCIRDGKKQQYSVEVPVIVQGITR